jgi:hypothetical protein
MIVLNAPKIIVVSNVKIVGMFQDLAMTFEEDWVFQFL